MAKKAVLIGINYPETRARLRGCVNDVKRVYKSLVDRFGFSKEEITVLIDTDESHTKPTEKNTRQALSRLVQSAKPGDFLFVRYSGHGTRLPAESGEDDYTAYDECIVPCDMNLITDDEFRDLVSKVPQGCRITIVSDSCHSGGLVDNAKEQMGESTKHQVELEPESAFIDEDKHKIGQITKLEEELEPESAFTDEATEKVGVNAELQEELKPESAVEYREVHLPSGLHDHYHHPDEEDFECRQVELEYGEGIYVKSRSLAISNLVEILQQKTGKDNIGIGKLRSTLFSVFGEDVNPKVKKFVEFLNTKLQQAFPKLSMQGYLGYYAERDMQPQVGSRQEVYAGTGRNSLPENGILISACQSAQRSADFAPPGQYDEAYGALINAIQTVLAETKGSISTQELVLRARQLLHKQGFIQRPGLYCRDHHVDVPFVCPSD